MGGFVFFSCGDAGNQQRAGSRALEMMRARGLETSTVIRRPSFELHLYRKRRFVNEHVVEFDNGDFVAGTGTLIYEGASGSRALQRLFEDFVHDRLSFEDLHGQFAVWIGRGERLYLFNDYRGMQHVYHDDGFTLVSSSFLAMQAGTRACEPNLQELHEYLTYGWYYGHRSLLKGIYRLRRESIFTLLPEHAEQPKAIRSVPYDGPDTFDGRIGYVHAVLRRYFETLVGIFGDRISLGLTGGYDSRMTLAYLLHVGCRPHLYVQGPDHSTDVRIAKQVAGAVGLPIAHDPAAPGPDASPDAFERQIFASALYLDGVHPAGLFQDWALAADARRMLPRPEKLRLYGMIAEIFRRSIPLPERAVSVDAFLDAWAEKIDVSSYRASFSKAEFRRQLGDKLVAALGLDARRLAPLELQLVYPYFKGPANTGWQMSAQGERAHALCPYAEACITEAAQQVPIPYRRHGRFQSALIVAANPTAAAVQSSYGRALSEQPAMTRRWLTNARNAFPTSLRPHLYRLKSRRKSPALPFYLQESYVRLVFPRGFPILSELLDLEAERDVGILSRAYTLELLLSGRFLDLT